MFYYGSVTECSSLFLGGEYLGIFGDALGQNAVTKKWRRTNF